MRRILLVEDTDQHARLVQRHAEQFDGPRVEVTRAATLAEGLEQLERAQFDAVLLDLSLPDSAWENTLRVVTAAAPRVPLVVLTSVGDLELAADAVAQGADDYVVKSVMDANVLQRALRYAIERKKITESLRRRTEELEQSNEALKHFAHTVAHELRQPLNGTSLHLGLTRMNLGKGAAGLDAALAALGQVEEGMEDMARMVTDLLEFASLDQADEQRNDCDFNELLKDVLDDLEHEIEESQATVVVAPDLPTAPCNARFLRHVFRNLIVNAIKYSGERRPEISIAAEDAGEAWNLSVADNGVGLAEGERELVFEMFKRLSAGGQVDGNGIGLALCRRIVEHHGGEIRVESVPGEGSTFSFTLPKQVAPCDVPEVAASEDA